MYICFKSIIPICWLFSLVFSSSALALEPADSTDSLEATVRPESIVLPESTELLPTESKAPLFDSLWVNVRGGMGSGFANSISIQRDRWGIEYSNMVIDKKGWFFGDSYFEKNTREPFEPEIRGGVFSAFYRYIGSIGSGKASLGLGYFSGEWGFNCDKEPGFLGDNQYCDKNNISDAALVFGAEAILGRFWGLGISADYTVLREEVLIMAGLSLPIRLYSK